MSLVFESIEFHEIPQSDQHLHPFAIQPSSVDELDDPRTILYILQDAQPGHDDVDDIDIRIAAALAAQRQRLHQEQQQLEALQRLESSIQQDRIIDAIGRRILALNGYDMPDIWHPAHPYHFHRSSAPHLAHFGQPDGYSYHAAVRPLLSSAMQLRNDDGGHDFLRGYAPASSSSASTSSRSALAAFNPFVHAAPLILNRDRTPYSSEGARRAARIAVHPVTGLPMLFSEEPGFYDEVDNAAGDEETEGQYGAWDDDTDVDWLGRELLLRDRGAPVWILDASSGSEGKSGVAATAPRTDAKGDYPGAPAFEVTEYDEPDSYYYEPVGSGGGQRNEDDERRQAEQRLASLFGGRGARRDVHALASALAAMSRDSPQPPDVASSQAQQPVASNDVSPAPPVGGAATSGAAASEPVEGSKQDEASTPPPPPPPRSRSRAATVMSESEEEELETVGKVEPLERSASSTAGGVPSDAAGGVGSRPAKVVKVADTRT